MIRSAVFQPSIYSNDLSPLLYRLNPTTVDLSSIQSISTIDSGWSESTGDGGWVFLKEGKFFTQKAAPLTMTAIPCAVPGSCQEILDPSKAVNVSVPPAQAIAELENIIRICNELSVDDKLGSSDKDAWKKASVVYGQILMLWREKFQQVLGISGAPGASEDAGASPGHEDTAPPKQPAPDRKPVTEQVWFYPTIAGGVILLGAIGYYVATRRK